MHTLKLLASQAFSFAVSWLFVWPSLLSEVNFGKSHEVLDVCGPVYVRPSAEVQIH